MRKLSLGVSCAICVAFVSLFACSESSKPAAKAVADDAAAEKAAAEATAAVKSAAEADVVEADVEEVEVVVEEEAAPAADVAEAVVEAEAVTPAAPAASIAAATAEAEEILLGTPELTAGIPGAGESLSDEEIQTWLDNPKNHVTLTPTLPLGLLAGAAQIAGLDVNPLTRAKIELGRQLFFDPRLSKDATISCASCHHPDFSYAKDTQFGEGVGGQLGGRNSPAAYNRILTSVQFWDGRAATLEEQAKGPIANPIEMSNTHDVCVSYLAEIPGYKLQFEKIFPDGVNIENVARAIASFERTLVTAPTPWDYYEQLRDFKAAYEADLEDLDALKEDDPDLYEEYMALKAASDAHPISESAIRGGELFFSDKSACTACHVGANYTDELYHNLGVGMDAAEPDLGRFVVTKDEKDRGAFKTPTIRNVALTAPYMHDGSQKTLAEVVEWYDKGGHPNPHLDEKIKPLKLTDQEKADLVAFMEALTGDLPKVEPGRLPK